MSMKNIRGGVTAPTGFYASGISCGIKKSGAKDLSLIYSEKLCDAVGVFTTNQVQASCVIINKENLKNGKAQAIIVNSGNANCMTGKRGFANSRKIVSSLAKQLGLSAGDVCIASTGIIGKPLPVNRIIDSIPLLAKKLNKRGSRDAGLGIMTTDKTMKEAAVEFLIGKKRVRIGAIAKGAGMIHPEMALSSARHATMLCFVTTDAAISPSALREALDSATQKSFNMITVDGDMSTNDMVLVLANGMAENKKIADKSKEFQIFSKALESVLLTLAKLIVQDAEGATKFVEVSVLGARNEKDARIVARKIASSNLVKCALYGSDPNWGRIAAAAGQSGAHIDQWKMKICLGKELVLKNGCEVKKKAGVLDKIFSKKNIKITVDLCLGRSTATAYTCDLSSAYVKLNSAYST